MVRAGQLAGVRTEALLTRMDAPLGRAVGNAVEVIESIETLRGQGPRDLTALSVLLAARMVLMAGRRGDAGGCRAAGAGGDCVRAPASRDSARWWRGRAAIRRWWTTRRALRWRRDAEIVRAPRAGYVTGLEAMLIGRAAAALGAGRATAEDTVDHGVGIRVLATPGSLVRAGEPVLELIHRDGRGLKDARRLALQAIELGGAPPAPQPLVVGEIV